jgi:hypothetical protein
MKSEAPGANGEEGIWMVMQAFLKIHHVTAKQFFQMACTNMNVLS